MALVGGATRKPLLLRLLRHHQHTATSVELNGDRLDPSTGFAATLAARIVSGGRMIVVEISRLFAAGGAAHAGIAPMHRCHLGVK